jgi:chromosome segregation ATPase
MAELDQEIAAMQQRGLELRAEVERHEHRIQFNQERLREISDQDSKAVAEMTQAEERRRAAESELASVNSQLAEGERAVEEHRAALTARQQALREVDDSIRAQQETLRQAQSAAFSAAQELSRVRNELNSLDLQKQGNGIRLEKLSAEKIQIEEERARLEARLQDFSTNLELERVNAQAQRGTVEERQARLRRSRKN